MLGVIIMSVIPMLEKFKFGRKTKNTVKKMGKEADSNLFGVFYNWNISEFSLTEVSRNNKELYLKLIEIGKRANPDFDFTGIMVNKNCRAVPHRDKNNFGNSIIVGLGDYEGGNLCIVDEEAEEILEYDIKYNFLEFDGRFIHYNTPITKGDKWTLIYFKNNICNKNKIFINRNAYPTFTNNKTKTNNKN